MAAVQAELSSFDVDSEFAHMIKESDAGRTVPPDNGFALYEAIISLYRNPEMVKRFQGNGRRYIEENCSRHASTRAFIEVIERGMDDV
jgi:glycosyltransferase involved in cell wall biosynthesis